MDVENKTIEVRAYNPAALGALVFNQVWTLNPKGGPVSNSVIEAFFHIRDTSGEKARTKLELSLGNGITWDDAKKSFHIKITNDQASFIRETSEMDYSLYVTWDYGAVQTIREGTVTAVKVA